jgi:hypothetical protein
MHITSLYSNYRISVFLDTYHSKPGSCEAFASMRLRNAIFVTNDRCTKNRSIRVMKIFLKSMCFAHDRNIGDGRKITTSTNLQIFERTMLVTGTTVGYLKCVRKYGNFGTVRRRYEQSNRLKRGSDVALLRVNRALNPCHLRRTNV